ncbi:MAG: DUF433 domain-containing protein [Bryobacterales bacterium]|nr:DUF433 domain-containing protein [Bryobacterales bacterium]
MRMTVDNVLDYLASGMAEDEILHDFPDLTRDDIEVIPESFLNNHIFFLEIRFPCMIPAKVRGPVCLPPGRLR